METTAKERREKVFATYNRHKDYAEDYIKNGIETNRKGFGRISVKDADGKPVKGATVKLVQKSHTFKFGCNIFMLDEFENEEKNAKYREIFHKYFNYATVPFYWSDLEPVYGKPRYAKDSPKVYRRPAPDLCVEYCKEHGMRMKGHCLAYDTSKFHPDYLPRDVREAKIMYDKHFAEIGARYADVIEDFDVTNELLCRRFFNKEQPALINEYDYLEWVFEVAKKYFPYNGRIINEAALLGDGDLNVNRTPYYMMIERMLKNGAPCNKVSFQAHSFWRRADEPNCASFRYNPIFTIEQMRLYHDFGLPMQISEVTLPAYSLDAGDEEIQAEILHLMYRLWFAAPGMEGIVYWNFVDGYAAWAPQGTLEGENYFCGGMLRYDMTEKPILKAYKSLIDSWHTETTVTTDCGGEAVFKGFYGDYDAIVTTEKGESTHSFKLDTHYERPYDIKL